MNPAPMVDLRARSVKQGTSVAALAYAADGPHNLVRREREWALSERGNVPDLENGLIDRLKRRTQGRMLALQALCMLDAQGDEFHKRGVRKFLYDKQFHAETGFDWEVDQWV